MFIYIIKKALKYVNQNPVELQIEVIDIYKMKIRDFCISVSIIARISRHKNSKDIGDMKYSVNITWPNWRL